MDCGNAIDCGHAREQIHLYLDNQLSGPETENLEKHLSKCQECQKELAIMRKLIGAVQDESLIDPPADFTGKFMQLLLDPVYRTSRYQSVLFWFAQLCLAATALFLGWLFRGEILRFSHSFISHAVTNFGGFLRATPGSQWWRILLWSIIGCGATVVGIQTAGILNVVMRQRTRDNA